MTAAELKEKYPPPIMWQEWRTSVESVDKMWATGSTSMIPNSPIYANFHILFKDGSRKDFEKHLNYDAMMDEVKKYLESIKE